MSSITEFLLARIAEDEAEAKTLPYWFNPPKLLAECEAKRAIIKAHENWPVLVDRKPTVDFYANDLQNTTFRMSVEIAWLTEREYVKRFGTEPPTAPMMRALAVVYSGHPDYREDWS